jgi:UDP-glucose 4-epimerase
MERLEAGQPPIIFGDGSQTMDMVHVRDVARANLLAAKSSAGDAVFNVGSGTETSLLQLAERFAAAMGRPQLRPTHAEQRSINPVPRRLASTEAAQRSLGFEATIAPKDGIADLVAWWRGEIQLQTSTEKAS